MNVHCALLKQDGKIIGIKVSPDESSPDAKVFCGQIAVALVHKDAQAEKRMIHIKDGNVLMMKLEYMGAIAYQLSDETGSLLQSILDDSESVLFGSSCGHAILDLHQPTFYLTQKGITLPFAPYPEEIPLEQI